MYLPYGKMQFTGVTGVMYVGLKIMYDPGQLTVHYKFFQLFMKNGTGFLLKKTKK